MWRACAPTLQLKCVPASPVICVQLRQQQQQQQHHQQQLLLLHQMHAAEALEIIETSRSRTTAAPKAAPACCLASTAISHARLKAVCARASDSASIPMRAPSSLQCARASDSASIPIRAPSSLQCARGRATVCGRHAACVPASMSCRRISFIFSVGKEKPLLLRRLQAASCGP